MFKQTTRRTILQAMGMSALAALLLGPRDGRADAATRKRLIWIATPNGTIMEKLWGGQSFDDLFTSGRILQPNDAAGFASLKEKIAVLRGIDVKSAYKDPKPKDHQPDYLNMLIARQPKQTDGAKPAGISMDQLIAKELAKNPATARPFASVTLGTNTNYNSWNSFVATGENQPVAPIQDPKEAFHQLFDGFSGGGTGTISPRNAERLSVLDAVAGELSSLQGRLSCDEREKLGTHVAALEELENQIKLLPVDACTAPNEPAKAVYDKLGNNYPAIVKAHMDLIVATLACDLSRVVTLQLGRREIGHSWLGIDSTHHDLAHSNGPGTKAEQRLMQAKIEHWYAEQFYYLIRKLDSIPDDNGGTLLDNTVVVWAHEQATGSGHSRNDHPYVLAGSCGGAIPTGFRKHHWNANDVGPAHSGLLMTIAHAMGVPVDEFGDPDFSKGPLTLD